MYQFIFSAFADEIHDDLLRQMDVLEQFDIKHIEFRSASGKNISDFSVDEAKDAYATMQKRGFAVSSIGSPIGKIDITDDFTSHLERFRHTIKIAQTMKTQYIRLFSFFIPENEDPAQYRDEIMERLHALVKAAEGQDVILLHENEKEIYGDIPERCLDIIETINSPILKAAYDFSNFVQCGVRNYPEAWSMLRDHVVYIHMKDSVYTDESIVRDQGREVTGNAHRPVGMGDGDCKRIIEDLKQREFKGFLSLEPHLGEEYGATDEERFEAAANAALKIVK